MLPLNWPREGSLKQLIKWRFITNCEHPESFTRFDWKPRGDLFLLFARKCMKHMVSSSSVWVVFDFRFRHILITVCLRVFGFVFLFFPFDFEDPVSFGFQFPFVISRIDFTELVQNCALVVTID